jgi:hypothetical protein
MFLLEVCSEPQTLFHVPSHCRGSEMTFFGEMTMRDSIGSMRDVYHAQFSRFAVSIGSRRFEQCQKMEALKSVIKCHCVTGYCCYTSYGVVTTRRLVIA